MPGIVVVTYNSADVVGPCLEACLRIAGAEVVVVDNASTDDSVKRIKSFSNVKLLANSINRGFAGAVNQGFSALDSPAVLILNPDAVPLSGVERLEQAVLGGNVGAATGRLIGSDGLDQNGFNVRALPTVWTLAFEVLGLNRLWPANPVNRRYRIRAPEKGGEVEQPAGAFLMIRRSAWAAIGGFDESFYPIWFEDVDFCVRLKNSGYKILFVPEAIARHQGAHSASRLSWEARQVFWYGSLLRYASKHLNSGARRVVGLAVILACFPRAFAAMLRLGVLRPVSVYSRVGWLAGKSLR